jgi:nucleotide-binding universal stress UspA family protein
MPYSVIVVGTDGSERAEAAVGEALVLARAAGATLHAVHVVHPAVEAGQVSSSAWQQAIDGVRGELDNVREKLTTEAAQHGVAVEFHTPGGSDIADALLHTAEEVGADLIVVGNRGMSGLSRFVLGSIPNKLAHHCRCSLLIANTGAA